VKAFIYCPMLGREIETKICRINHCQYYVDFYEAEEGETNIKTCNYGREQ
jgi:hypothetical protein